jgi:hypothetical protein
MGRAVEGLSHALGIAESGIKTVVGAVLKPVLESCG